MGQPSSNSTNAVKFGGGSGARQTFLALGVACCLAILPLRELQLTNDRDIVSFYHPVLNAPEGFKSPTDVENLSTTAVRNNSVNQHVQPQHHGTRSPACFPSFGGKHHNISRIYFSHTRKAGGTTLRRYLSEVARAMNFDYVVNEHSTQEFPGRNDTL
jgi:hypothetical protein